MRGRVLVATTAAALLAAGAAVAASVGGDQHGIALARSQQAAYAKIAAETVHETGFVAMHDFKGRRSFFDWQWGSGAMPHGWVPATEHAIAALRHDRIVWWRDDLTPVCHKKGCTEAPVDVVIDRKGGFFAFGNARHHTCYGKLRGSTPVKAGSLWNQPHGTYSAPVTRGSRIRLTYAYPWGGSQTATETDTIARRTLLDRSGVIRISGGGRPSLTVHFTNRHPKKAPPAPRVKLCSG